MNGYKMTADSYREVLKRDRDKMTEDAITNMERSIRVFEILAEFQPEDKYTVFDSSMFNDIFKGYVKRIIDELCDDEDEDIQKAAQKILGRVYGKSTAILDRTKAREAEEYYLKS